MITVDYLPTGGAQYVPVRTPKGRVKRFLTPAAAERFAVGLIRSGVAKETNCCGAGGGIFAYFDAYSPAERRDRLAALVGP